MRLLALAFTKLKFCNFLIVLLFIAHNNFAQTDLREYVGFISVTGHPDIVAFVDKIKAAEAAEDAKNKKPDNSTDEAEKALPKIPPYEHPVGSGFLFKANDGNTYVITNWHVISHNWEYSITFEKSLDEKAVYSRLRLLAADEESDLALLAFDPTDNPGRNGLSLLERPVREGEEVFSAGFPALGRNPVWQLGRGQISNAQVMLHKRPWDEEDETMEGPFIQHTSQVDPGNSGGPLLVEDASSSLGYAIAGVNARSARRRQAANYSVTVKSVRDFLEQVFNPSRNTETEREKLDEQLDVFIKELKRNNYALTDWISYQFFLDNMEYAFYWASVKNTLYGKFAERPMGILTRAINNLMRDSVPSLSKDKKDSISIVSIEKEDDDTYKVVFLFAGKELSTRWTLEQGAWKIASFGKADGDKSKISKAEKLYYNQNAVRTGYNDQYKFYIEGGYTLAPDHDPAVYSAFYSDFGGLRCFFTSSELWQTELFGISYLTPKRFGIFALESYVGTGLGIKKLPKTSDKDTGLRFGISPYAGIEFTSSLVPGLYLGSAYQYNLYFQNSEDKDNARHLFTFLAGYRSKKNETKK